MPSKDDNDNHTPNDNQQAKVGMTGMLMSPEPQTMGKWDRVAFGGVATKRGRLMRDDDNDDDDDVIVVVILYFIR